MKLVIQRVSSAKIFVQDKTAGEIQQGLFVLVGLKKGDTQDDADHLADKLVKLRVMADESGKMNKTVQDINASFLIVSQFTLYANTTGGNRPSFIDAQEPTKAKVLYEYFVEKLKVAGVNVETGIFGEYMKIDIKLDGPVTILIES